MNPDSITILATITSITFVSEDVYQAQLLSDAGDISDHTFETDRPPSAPGERVSITIAPEQA